MYFDTSVAETAAPGDVRIFTLAPGAYASGFTLTFTVSAALDAEVALGVATPEADALLPSSWRPLILAATTASTGGSATVTIAVPTSSPAFIGSGLYAK